VKDSERKRALTTKVSCFELFRTTHKKEIRVMDADVSNSKMHVLSLIAALADTCPY
jgi:WD40 repeat protein